MQILIIDKKCKRRVKFERFLNARGCQVVVSGRLVDAMESAKQVALNRSLDIVLVDQELVCETSAKGAHKGSSFFDKLKAVVPSAAIIVMATSRDTPKTSRLPRKVFCTYLFAPKPEDVWELITRNQKMRRHLADCSWLWELVEKDLGIGISVIDKKYRLWYVNECQRQITTRCPQIGGICWLECYHMYNQKKPCPWCPTLKVFADGETHESAAVSPSPVDGHHHLYDVVAVPIKDPVTNEIVAVTELVRDCTERVLNECRAAILENKDTFRDAIEKILCRICHLGFDRARLWIERRDPQYLEGLATYGHHAEDVVHVRLDQLNDYYFRRTRRTSTFKYYDGTGPHPDPAMQRLRNPDTPWIEGPLKMVLDNGKSRFLGKINLDNEPTGRDLISNKESWQLLTCYADLLAPLIYDARCFWIEQERSEQMAALHDLDKELVRTNDVKNQMKSIVKCAEILLKPDHCHIRCRQGKFLSLVADTGLIGRVRSEVHIERDKETSVSVKQIRSRKPQQVKVYGPGQLRSLANRLAQEPRLARASAYFRELSSCATFPLMDSAGQTIGTLVVDSKRPYFFDSETLSLANSLVHRAQVFVENSMRQSQLHSLLNNSIASEVVVLDAEANVGLHNKNWTDRVGGTPRRIHGRMSTKHARLMRCIREHQLLFTEAVDYVFSHKNKPTSLVVDFMGVGGHTRRMDVKLVPFEIGSQGETLSIAVVLSDITDWTSVRLLSENILQSSNLTEVLSKPMERIQILFESDYAAIVECLSFSGDDPTIKLWSYASRDSASFPEPQDIKAIHGSGKLILQLMKYGSITIADVADSKQFAFPKVSKFLIDEWKTSAILAVPVYLSGELWGILAIGQKRKHSFDGRDVDLLRAAATQISSVVSMSQQVRLRTIDREITQEIGGAGKGDEGEESQLERLLKKIVEHATQLTNSQGGHIRTMDWYKDVANLKVATDSFMIGRKTVFRKLVKVGEPVAGIVAQTCEPHIVNDCKKDPFEKRLRRKLPPGMRFLHEFLALEKSSVCYPLIANEEILGTLTISARYKDHYTIHRQQLLYDFAARAASVLQKAQHIERMHDMARSIDDILNVRQLQDLWPKIPDVAVQLFNAEDAAVSSYSNQTDLLCREAIFEGHAHAPRIRDVAKKIGASTKRGCGLTRFIARKGNVIRFEGEAARNHSHLWRGGSDYHKYLPSKKLVSFMVARLDTPERIPVGVLEVVNRKGRRGERGFTEFDEAIMRLVSTKFAIAIERLRFMETRNRAIIIQAHGLKTPLQNIRLTLSSLMDGVFNTNKDLEDIKMAWRSVELLDAFIFSTLDVAQGRIDPSRIEPKDVDTEVVVRKALDVMIAKLKQYEFEVDLDIAPSARHIYADEKQLLHVLLNLCYNTVVHGRAKPDAAKSNGQKNTLEIKVWCKNDECVLQVADRGPGIRDTRKGRPTKSRGQVVAEVATGSGIGLAATRLIAQVHGGTLRVSKRKDGKSGAVIEMRWNQLQLREKYGTEKRLQKGATRNGKN